MANDIKEIADVVKKSKILLLDIEGTTTSISFVKDKLFPYAEENVKQFLDSNWEEGDVKEAVSALRKLALEDKENSVDGVVAIPAEDASKEDQIEALVNSVKWQMSSDRKVGALKQLQGLIWKQGYDKGDIKGHVYDDVSPAIEKWRSVEGQKVYIYSSGSVQAQKLLFGQSMAGDMLKLIDGHFDTSVGAKQEASSYTAIVEKIGSKADEILFLTDIVKEAEAAASAGLQVALVSREGNAPLPADITAKYPVIHSFEQLTVSNKRKTDPQDEQPAKIPKTETDVKTEEEVASENAAKKVTEQSEKMEVENDASAKEEAKEQKTDESPVVVDTVVEEITDSPTDVPVCDVEPVVEEKTEESNEKTEKMETDEPEIKSTPEAKENGDEKAPLAEETPPAIEIEEITTDKPTLGEVADIIEGLEPVVEEPPASEDMEELQNVGEVLEKECDEILSKVQDVTNLDNIPVKPLSNPIEVTMETENVDTNDIVDRILDTELEMEMKQCEEIALNTVTEITPETKAEANGIKEDKVSSEIKDTTEKKVENEETNEIKDKTIENSKETKKATEVNNTEKPVESESKDTPVVESSADTVPTVGTEKTTEVVKDTAGSTKGAAKETLTVTETAKEIEPTTETTETAKDVTETVKEETTKEVAENKDTAKVEEAKPESTEEPHVNGDTNGDTVKVTLNGDTSKEEELSARLSVENGKEMNGANGELNNFEKGQGDNGVEKEVTDIKVKTVATEEPQTDPIEQPTEA